MASQLENPHTVLMALRKAGDHLSEAHRQAGEREWRDGKWRSDLTGWTRDAIFGINSTLDAIVGMLADQFEEI